MPNLSAPLTPRPRQCVLPRRLDRTKDLARWWSTSAQGCSSSSSLGNGLSRPKKGCADERLGDREACVLGKRRLGLCWRLRLEDCGQRCWERLGLLLDVAFSRFPLSLCLRSPSSFATNPVPLTLQTSRGSVQPNQPDQFTHMQHPTRLSDRDKDG